MKTTTKVMMAILCVQPAFAWAQADKGHGGLAIVCRDSATGAIKSARLLDLVEAEQIDGLKIPLSNASVEEQLKAARFRIPNELGAQKFDKLKNGMIITELDNPDFGLPNPNDYTPRVTGKGCNFEVIGLYRDQTGLQIDREIYNALPRTHQAAFLVHEYVYKAARFHGATNSDDSRLFVAQLFAQNYREDTLESLMVSESAFSLGVYCQIGDGYGNYPRYFFPAEKVQIVASIGLPKAPDLSVLVTSSNGYMSIQVGRYPNKQFAVYLAVSGNYKASVTLYPGFQGRVNAMTEIACSILATEWSELEAQ